LGWRDLSLQLATFPNLEGAARWTLIAWHLEAIMLIKSDLDAPAHLQCWPIVPDL
jgi:hypothetical protein